MPRFAGYIEATLEVLQWQKTKLVVNLIFKWVKRHLHWQSLPQNACDSDCGHTYYSYLRPHDTNRDAKSMIQLRRVNPYLSKIRRCQASQDTFRQH
jgi:hypothetical protein